MKTASRIRRFSTLYHGTHLALSILFPTVIFTGLAIAFPNFHPGLTGFSPKFFRFLHVGGAAAVLLIGFFPVARDFLIAAIEDRPLEKLPLWINRRDLKDAFRSLGCRIGMSSPPDWGWFSLGEKLDFWVPIITLPILTIFGWLASHSDISTNMMSSETYLKIRLLHQAGGIVLLAYLLLVHLFRVFFLSPSPAVRTFLTGTVSAAEMKSAHPRAWREAVAKEAFREQVERGDIILVLEEREKLAEAMTAAAGEALRIKRHHRALRLLARALKARPDYPEALLLLGRCHERLGNLGDARAAYTRYLAINPEGDESRMVAEKIGTLNRLLDRRIGR